MSTCPICSTYIYIHTKTSPDKPGSSFYAHCLLPCRAGRCGRMGRKGTVVTLVAGDKVEQLQVMLKRMKITPTVRSETCQKLAPGPLTLHVKMAPMHVYAPAVWVLSCRLWVLANKCSWECDMHGFSCSMTCSSCSYIDSFCP